MRIPLTDSYSEVLECPICPVKHRDYNYVHLGAVKVNAGGEITVVEPSGNLEYKYKPVGRGAEIVIYCWCEAGHTFELSFEFYKGQTFVRSVRDADIAEDADGSAAWPPDLWRD